MVRSILPGMQRDTDRSDYGIIFVSIEVVALYL